MFQLLFLQHPGDIGSFSDPSGPSAAVLSCLSCDDVLPGSTTRKGNSKSSDAGKHQPRWDLRVTAGLEKPVLHILSLFRHHGCVYIYIDIYIIYIDTEYVYNFVSKYIHCMYVSCVCIYIVLYCTNIIFYYLYCIYKNYLIYDFFFNIYILYIYIYISLF